MSVSIIHSEPRKLVLKHFSVFDALSSVLVGTLRLCTLPLRNTQLSVLSLWYTELSVPSLSDALNSLYPPSQMHWTLCTFLVDILNLVYLSSQIGWTHYSSPLKYNEHSVTSLLDTVNLVYLSLRYTELGVPSLSNTLNLVFRSSQIHWTRCTLPLRCFCTLKSASTTLWENIFNTINNTLFSHEIIFSY